MNIDPNDAIEYIFKYGKRYAKAKAERIYLEEYRKSLKALLMKRSIESTVNAQEREAYSDPEYVKHLGALRDSVEAEEELRWGLIAAQARIEVYRTQSANDRAMDRVTM